MISVIKKFNLLFDKKQKKKVFILFFIMLIGTAIEVMSVSMVVPIFKILGSEEMATNNKYVKMLSGVFHIQTYRGFVIFCIMVMIVAYIIKDSFVIFQNYMQTRFVCNNRVAMQKKMMRIMINRPYDFFLNVKTGEMTQMIVRDPSNVYSLLSTVLGTVTDVIVSLALGITVFIIEPWMTTLVAVVTLLCMLLITKFARPKIKEAGEIYRKTNSVSSSWIVQMVNGIKEIKVTRREGFFIRTFGEITDKGVRAEKTYKTINGIPKALIEMVSVCSALLAILILLLGGKSLSDLMPVLGAFVVAAVKLVPNANRIALALNEITYQQPYLDKLIENVKSLEQAEIADTNLKPDIEGKEQITLLKSVEVKGLSFKYPNTERYILENADLLVPAGNSIGIVGASGAGKTTSVDIILGILKAESGEILADGKNVMDNYADWLSHIGYIPQTIFMLDASIRDNIAFGITDDKVDDEKVWKAVKEAQLENFVKSLPQGLDSKVGERGVRISGGQRQRLGIARALYNDPELLVFDEATSSLDNETETAIMESINSLHGKKTIIIIAHRLQTIEGCDMVYRVENGKITRER